MRTARLALLILSAAGPALAQEASKTNPPAPIREPGPPQLSTPGTPGSAVVVGSGRTNAGPGANTTIVHSGTGADTVMTDPAVGGNAEQPSRAVPLQGRGGGGGGGQ